MQASSTPVITTTMIPRSMRTKLRTLPRLGERYPEVHSVQVKWAAFRKGAALESKTWLFRKNIRALLKLDCPCRGCFDGGFDLEPIVSAEIEKRIDETSVALHCEGWRSGTDSFRLHRCACELQVVLKIAHSDAN